MTERLPHVDITVAHPARRYNYWLGGADNFLADRESGDAIAAAFPSIRTSARENRRFLGRAVTHLARDLGIRQFLDIGTGIPSAGNTHEVALGIAPDARVVYVDNDPMVYELARPLVHARYEAVAYLEADLLDPERILNHPELRRLLDLREPVGLTLMAVLHFVGDDQDPYGLVNALTSALAPGSALALSHATADFMTAETAAAIDEAGVRTGVPGRLRSRAEIARFFDGMELLAPGIVPASDWRTHETEEPRPSAEEVALYAGAGVIREVG